MALPCRPAVGAALLLVALALAVVMRDLFPLLYGRDAEISEAERACEGPRMLIHVGPHKTGTSAFQNFLVENEAWLKEKWGVSLGFRGHPKATGRDIGRPILHSDCEALTDDKSSGQQRTRQELQKAIGFARSKLKSSSLVLLSSEAFSLFRNENWECLRRIIGKDVCLSVAVLHRDMANWIASSYAETTKNTSNPPGFRVEGLGGPGFSFSLMPTAHVITARLRRNR